MHTRLPVLTAILLAVLAPACKKDTPAAPATGAAPPPSVAGAPRPVPADLPAVVATVNGVDVKKEELQLAIRNIEGRAGQAVPPDQRDAVYRQVLDRVVGYHLLSQEAQARKISAPPWEVDKRLADLKSQFPNEQAFKDMMQQRGLSEDRLRQETAETFAVNAMLEQEFASLPPPDEAAVKAFYDTNTARFHQEASVRASHILIRVDQAADAATRDKAKGQIQALQAQLKKGGDFAALAKQHSQDPGSAANGGDLGFFTKGQMVPAFDTVAFSLKPGATSDIVETQFGYHLIRVAETKAERDVPFTEVREQIRAYLQQQDRDQKTQVFIDQLKTKGKVVILL